MPHGKSPTTPRKLKNGRWLHVSSPCALVPHPGGVTDASGKPVMVVAVVKGKGDTYNKRKHYESLTREQVDTQVAKLVEDAQS